MLELSLYTYKSSRNDVNRIKSVLGYQMCPFCGGRVEYAGMCSGHIFPALHTGQMYICQECGYKGSFILEPDHLDDVSELQECIQEHREMGDTDMYILRYPEKCIWLWRLVLSVLVFALMVKFIETLLYL